MKVFTIVNSFLLSFVLRFSCGFNIPTKLRSINERVGSTSSLSFTALQNAGMNNTVDILDGEKEDIQLKQSTLEKKMPNHDVGGPVQPIQSIPQFLNIIENAPQNSLIVVQYHAKWCKVCARVIVKLRQMAQRIRMKPTAVPIAFVSVEITANQDICSTLEIKKFPFIQMYRNKECIASFGTGPAHNFQRVVGGTIEEKLSMTDVQWESFRNEFHEEISSGLKKLDLLKLTCNESNSKNVN